MTRRFRVAARSRRSRRDGGPSDIDIAILLQSPSDLGTQEKISAAIERASGRTVDLAGLAHAPPLLAH